MTKAICFLGILLLASCTSTNKQEVVVDADSLATQVADSTEFRDTIEEVAEPLDEYDYNYATYHFVFSDSGKNYTTLSKKMHKISAASGLQIDTMGRYFDKDSMSLILSDTANDEMYRGHYFPRRYPAPTMSIEYADMYTKAGDSTFILVYGIYEEASEADSALARILTLDAAAYADSTEVFVGCIH